jgi:hypothetical protein
MKTKLCEQIINAVIIAVKSFPPILIVEHLKQEIEDYENEKRTNT